jgi:transcriptional regulator with XRE-family HTH domain
MPAQAPILLPRLQRILAALGQNIRMARLRRQFSAAIVAERAGISRTTLWSIERGDPNVTLGSYASVLLSLGLEKDLESVALDDVLGRKLQDLGLPTRARAPRRRSTRSVDEPSSQSNDGSR